VNHLIAAAEAIRKHRTDLADELYLDVYSRNELAIGLYAKRGFKVLNPANPIPDPAENNEPFVVMARPFSLAPIDCRP